jgi:hypothetical protein
VGGLEAGKALTWSIASRLRVPIPQEATVLDIPSGVSHSTVRSREKTLMRFRRFDDFRETARLLVAGGRHLYANGDDEHPSRSPESSGRGKAAG